MRRLLFLAALLAVTSTASGVVIRHDVDDSSYRVPPCVFPALVDMPGEAHGVLVAPSWIVTAAHTITGPVAEVTLGGVPRAVERLIVHSGYKSLPESLIREALASGDASKAMEFQASNKDIALIKLAQPVADVAPAIVYQGKDELGKLVKLLGRGATGDGADGENPHSSRRAELRRAFNTVSIADAGWLGYVFDADSSSHGLEGIGGSGDSGGPVLIEVNGQWQLAGLAAWKLVEGDAASFRAGIYGQTSYNVRLSSYAEWIAATISYNQSKPKPHEGMAASSQAHKNERGVVCQLAACASEDVADLGRLNSSATPRGEFSGY